VVGSTTSVEQIGPTSGIPILEDPGLNGTDPLDDAVYSLEQGLGGPGHERLWVVEEREHAAPAIDERGQPGTVEALSPPEQELMNDRVERVFIHARGL